MLAALCGDHFGNHTGAHSSVGNVRGPKLQTRRQKHTSVLAQRPPLPSTVSGEYHIFEQRRFNDLAELSLITQDVDELSLSAARRRRKLYKNATT